MKNRNNNKGFTLLEVLVALAVFSVAAIALMRVSESQLRISQTLEEKTFAHWIALNLITEMQVTKSWPTIGEQTDKVSMASREWKFKIKTQATPVARVRRVEVSVGIAPKDFSENMEALTVLTGFIERPTGITAEVTQ